MAYRKLLDPSKLSNQLQAVALRTSSAQPNAHSSSPERNVFNSFDTSVGFETRVPVNSPVGVVSFAVPQNRTTSRPKAADPRNRATPGDMETKEDQTESLPKVPIFGHKSSQLRRLVTDCRARPTTAHPNKRSRRSLEIMIPNVTPQSSLSPRNTAETLNHSFGNKIRSERPKGAHHKNHPMLIPGIAEQGTDDELDSSASSSEQFSSSTEPSGPHFLIERPPNNPRLTFVPG